MPVKIPYLREILTIRKPKKRHILTEIKLLVILSPLLYKSYYTLLLIQLLWPDSVTYVDVDQNAQQIAATQTSKLFADKNQIFKNLEISVFALDVYVHSKN